jgi:hypothetical protein
MVTVNTLNAIPGFYSYTIRTTNGPTNVGGWGNGGSAILNVQVNETLIPLVDTTEPAIAITSPAEAQAYILGETVLIDFKATEDLSPITAVSALVDETSVTLTQVGSIELTFNGVTGFSVIAASGSVVPTLIGTYTLTASATSAGGEAGLSRDFTVNYDMSNAWLPPLSLGKIAKGGSTIPIKFTVKDSAGNFVVDNSVKVVVYEGAANAFESLFGEGSAGVRIDETTGQYITNFKTATGAHNYRADVFFLDKDGAYVLQGSKSFSVK